MPEATRAGRAAGLREMAAGDLEAIARLESELFGAEAWSRDLLAAELAASHGPMADRRYVVVDSQESDGDGDADEAADRAAGAGPHGPQLLGYAGLYHAGGLTSADLLTIATVPAARGRGIASLMLAELASPPPGRWAAPMSCWRCASPTRSPSGSTPGTGSSPLAGAAATTRLRRRTPWSCG